MIALRAPAKINLSLRVLGRRSDGYHELDSIVQMVGLFDEVIIEAKRRGLALSVEGADLPSGPGNIAWAAAEALVRAAGGARGASLRLVKQIPLGAGLGGGSSDAAAVLMGLNRLWGLRWTRARLAALGATIGSDVPFFFFGPTARVTGRGERVVPLASLRPSTGGPLPEWAVLVNPGFSVSTKSVFDALRLTNEKGTYKMGRLSEASPPAVWSIGNDLEPVTVGRYPVIEEIKTRLVKAGASVARMSGSGPTVFGMYATRADARRACDGLPATWRRWTVRVLKRAPW